MRITLIISKMSNSGGTERVMSILSSELVKRDHKVTILTVSDTSKNSFYPLDPQIKLIKTDILGKIKNPVLKSLYFPVTLYKIRKAILRTKPDLIISFADILNILTIISLFKTKIPVIATEHFALCFKKIGNIWEFLRIKTYKLTKAITVITPEDKIFFSSVLSNKIHVVYNPIMNSSLFKTNYSDLKYELISVGRLIKDKGFDILVHAFSKVEKEFPKLKLNIYGSGPELSNLNNLINNLGLEQKIIIHDPVDNIVEKMVQSDIFVLSSKSESFGMVIAEAMSAGLPVISTDCPNGPRNIIENNVNGILIQNENIEELSEKIRLLLTDSELRRNLGNNAIKISDTLSVDKYMDKWNEMIKL
ncbi:MAG: glycosyltransferase family 4 protein [Candidatus Delongbacteria bacterium]|nr:glycosyltransferase family 4 protein [Candidatus Delongbacteria bacterium]